MLFGAECSPCCKNCPCPKCTHAFARGVGQGKNPSCPPPDDIAYQINVGEDETLAAVGDYVILPPPAGPIVIQGLCGDFDNGFELCELEIDLQEDCYGKAGVGFDWVCLSDDSPPVVTDGGTVEAAGVLVWFSATSHGATYVDITEPLFPFRNLGCHCAGCVTTVNVSAILYSEPLPSCYVEQNLELSEDIETVVFVLEAGPSVYNGGHSYYGCEDDGGSLDLGYGLGTPKDEGVSDSITLSEVLAQLGTGAAILEDFQQADSLAGFLSWTNCNIAHGVFMQSVIASISGSVSFSPCECVACCKANEDEFEIHEDINANPRIKGDKVRNPIDPCGCEQVAANFCAESGGDSCSENVCLGCRGPCCNEFGLLCVSSTEDECEDVFFGCCEPEASCLGGCCDTSDGTCELTTEAACDESGLAWLGCGVSCGSCQADAEPPCIGACEYYDEQIEAVACVDGQTEAQCSLLPESNWLGCDSLCFPEEE